MQTSGKEHLICFFLSAESRSRMLIGSMVSVLSVESSLITLRVLGSIGTAILAYV